jgi:hypothetical protein
MTLPEGFRAKVVAVDQSGEKTTVCDAKNQRTSIDEGQIESLKASLMPDDLPKVLKPQELR